MGLKETIAQINRSEIGNLRSSIDQVGVRFDWEDRALLPLLLDGPERVYEAWNADDKESEKAYVSSANELAKMVRSRAHCSDIDQCAKEMANKLPEAYAYRLRAYARGCIDDSFIRKGLLITGDGGIGKTRFLFDLAEGLAKKGKGFGISFSDQSAVRLLELDPNEVNSCFDEGFTFVFDAINERDKGLVARLLKEIPRLLAFDNISVIASTRSSSPFSYEAELESMLRKYVFPGVDIGNIIEELANYGEQLFFYFQDMFISGNPRNILAARTAVKELSERDGLQQAHIQRTTLVERCVKKQMEGTRCGKERWGQTKKICELLYTKRTSLFSGADVESALGDAASEYLIDMLSAGFIRSYAWTQGETVYAFSSESQMNVLVARSLHDDLDDNLIDIHDLRGSATRVAVIVGRKAFGANAHEMCQVAIDRFLHHGPELFVELLHAFDNAGINVDQMRIIRETMFPEGTDFSTINNRAAIAPAEAFAEFGGYVINPLNLCNYSNRALLCKPELMNEYFVKHWHSYELSDLIGRVKNISSYASYARYLAPSAVSEWVWLAVWTSASTNTKLRKWATRLMQVLCDRCPQAVEILVAAFHSVRDEFIRRAIAHVLSVSRSETKQRCDVVDLARSAVNDRSVVDYLIVRDLCRVLDLHIAESSGCNYYEEYGGSCISVDDVKAANELLFQVDLFFDHYLPFEYMKFRQGVVQMSVLHGFLAVDKGQVRSWNDRFSEMLDCPNPAPCAGEMVLWETANRMVPIPFEKMCLDSGRLHSMVIRLLIAAYEKAGGSISDLLGVEDAVHIEADKTSNPNYKPVSVALGAFMGSLAANYYRDEIEVERRFGTGSGFRSEDDWSFSDEVERVDSTLPLFNNVVDIARRRLLKRVQNPEGKPLSWFNDIDDAFEAILHVLQPIVIHGVEWMPLSVDVRFRVSDDHNLRCSNEMLIHVASIDAPHLRGEGDRRLTIELDELEGHVEDYCLSDSLTCVNVPAPEYLDLDSFSFAMCLPPQRIISHFGLVYNSSTGIYHYPGYEDPVVICDGNPRSFLSDPISKLILMRSREYCSLVDAGLIKYYAFTERFAPDDGYRNDCDRHWEFLPNGKLINSYLNDGSVGVEIEEGEGCQGCNFSRKERAAGKGSVDVEYVDPDWLSNLYSK